MQENIFPQFKRIKRISVGMVCHKRNPGMKRQGGGGKIYYTIGKLLLYRQVFVREDLLFSNFPGKCYYTTLVPVLINSF